MKISITLIAVVSTVLASSANACKILKSGFTKSEIQAILNAHNKLRNQVAQGKQHGQPAAANMAELVWDDSVAALAQSWANKCPDGHNPNRKVGSVSAGENIYWYFGSGLTGSFDYTQGVNDWFSEVSDFSSRDIKPYVFSGATGHYTQLMWATTTKVGCGAAVYGSGSSQTLALVCDYIEAGNMVGGVMYATGSPASKCSKRSATWPFLCAAGSSSKATPKPTNKPANKLASKAATTPADTVDAVNSQATGCSDGEKFVSVEGGEVACAPSPVCTSRLPSGNCPAGSHCGIVSSGLVGCVLNK